MKPRPALRTGQAVLPHPALQKDSCSLRLQFEAVGFFQTEKPQLFKVGVRPLLMITATAPSLLALVLAQDAAQAHAHPTIDARKDVPMAVLEVFEPAPQRGVDALDDLRHASSLRPASFLANRLPELVQALLARPFHAPFKVVAQKVEPAFRSRIHDPRLGRMNRQPVLLRPLANLFQRLVGFLLAPALND